MMSIVFAAIAMRGTAAEVVSFTLGTSTNFHSVAVMHGHRAFNKIQITFNRDVFVDFYDLHLGAVGSGAYSMPLAGFSYNQATRTATWQVDGQPAEQNERFRAILRGVWEADNSPLTGGGYTNEFSVLTGDVTGDNAVGSIDSLTIINHINGMNPYNATLDVNNDNAVSPIDSLIVINIINSSGGYLPLIDPGAYSAVSYDPPPHLRITDIVNQEVFVTLGLAGVATGSRLRVEEKIDLLDTKWQPVFSTFATNGTDRVKLKENNPIGREFYRVLFD